MDTTDRARLIRVVRGSPDAAELAALTAVMLARAVHAAGARDAAGRGPAAAGWRRLERRTGFLGPRTWRDNTSVPRSA